MQANRRWSHKAEQWLKQDGDNDYRNEGQWCDCAASFIMGGKALKDSDRSHKPPHLTKGENEAEVWTHS